MSPPRTLVTHFGQHAPELVRELAARRALFRYWTGFALSGRSSLAALLQYVPGPLASRLRRRIILGVQPGQLRVRPIHELRAKAWLHLGRPYDASMYARNALLQRAVSDIDLRASDVVVGFDTCSWILGDRARRFDRPFILDQSTVHQASKSETYVALRARFPLWADDFLEKIEEHIGLERSEHELANRIVVASDFTARTLVDNGVPAQRIVRIPYGVDLGRFQPPAHRDVGRPFRFAYMGLVNARKGVPVLLEAWARGRPEGAELWVIGNAPEGARRLLAGVPGLTVLGHRPHAELPALLAECDALVFPSFFEGFGMVLLEALAMGLPVIATDATAAPDLDDGSGAIQVVPTGDVEAFAAAMATAKSEWAGGSKRDASRAIAERYSWRRYGDAWLRLLEEVVAESSLAPHSRPMA